ncbi:MAG: cytochrome oxidase small assembly protein [Burkholderiaceae bacterium]
MKQAQEKDSADAALKRRNLRTALVLLVLAGAFFVGVIAKYW